MSRMLFSLVSVLLLSLASTSYGDIGVGNFEANLDGWAAADATLTFSPLGATLNYLSLQVTGPGGWHIDAKLDMKPNRTLLGVKGTTVTADVTAFEADMTTTWMQVEFVINAQNNNDAGANNNIGWKGLGGQDIARDGLPHTYTWAIPDDLADAIAKTDPNIWWFEFALVSNVDGASATKFYIDNIQVKDPAKKIIYVTSVKDMDKNGVQDDLSWVDWLTAEGYKVDARPDYWKDPLDANDINELNAADLIIASRGMNTGDYDGAETPKWNALTKPILCTNAWMVRNNRWKWMNSGDARKDADSPIMMVLDPNHPVFAGVALDPDGLVEVLDPNVASGHTSFLNNILDPGNGTLLAQSLGVYNTAWIVEWAAGVEYYAGAVEVAGDRRLLFMAGTQDDPYTVPDGNIAPVGVFNLNEAGQQTLRNAIQYLLTPPPVPFVNLLTNGDFETGTTDPWGIWGDSTFEVVTECAGAAVPEPPIQGTYCLHVTVPAKTTNFWDTGMNTAPPIFEAGKKYTLSVWLKSKSGPVTVNLKPEHSADPWQGYGEKQVTMTDTWAEYSITTPPFATDVSPASITFHLGFAQAEFWVDNVRWYEGDYVKP